jgi:PAS domain-containing protein
MAIALCVCLGTILWCILQTRRQQNQLDRSLTGLLGLIAIYEALRVLRDSGVGFFWHFYKLDGWADFLVATLCLIAALIIRLSGIDRSSTKARLRLIEANEKPARIPRHGRPAADLSYLLFDVSPLATFAVDSHNHVIYWNSAAEDLLGWTRDEVLGHPLPFDQTGELVNKRGRKVDAVVWTAPIRSIRGSARATLTIAAGRAALRSAGLSGVPASEQGEFAPATFQRATIAH